VLNNTIRDGSDGGIVVHNNARATVKGNTISGNKKAGITLCTGASAIVTENTILGGKGAGILCHTDAGGVLRGNRISQVEKAGVEIRKRASTEVLANVIFNCSAQGVHVHSEGKGNIEGNTISKCKGPLVEICGASAPVLKHNQLEGGVGGAQGFLVYDRACPEIANNILKECAKAAIHISDYALPTGTHTLTLHTHTHTHTHTYIYSYSAWQQALWVHRAWHRRLRRGGGGLYHRGK